MNNRWVKYLIAGSVTVLMVLVIIFIIRSVKENSLVVTCPDTLVVEYGSTNDEADINETIKKNVLGKKDNKTDIEIEGNVDVTKLGKYDIKIVASRKKKHISRKVAVKVVDTQAPVISLSGDTEITIEAGSNYEEAGFSAVDNYDGDITDKVETSAEVDTYTKGDTTIVYSVKDSSGNEAFTERVIHVEDTTAPQISLTGGEVYYFRMGDTYNEPGYTAVDICDGDVTDKVSVSGNVDTANAGKYTVTYNVSDNCGNESEVQRTVKVVAPMSDDAVNPGDKVVYLTFDDGPGPYTEKLLDILDRYNVKATFLLLMENRIIRILLHKKHSGDILLQYIQHHMIMQRYIRV